MAARSIAQAIFGGKQVDPKEQVKQWRLKIRGEMRTLQRQCDTIEREEKKIKAEIKKAWKENQPAAAKMLAKEVIRSQKARERILLGKANLNSMDMQLNGQLASMRVVGSMEKSTELMALMNNAVKLQEVSQTVRELSQEMERAGIIEECINDSLESLEPEDLEAESELEVQRVLAELGVGQMDAAPHAPSAKVGEVARPVEEVSNEEPLESEGETADMEARIAALRAA
uniref:Uncharacterized protein n=1 Tax=Guillardia theta TaxID=55529 RepID=A0A7S4P3E8_GUITH|mmetsp:Transcript_42376/g.133522  ORF Transcript_42376/g.133522 Transcript_42376/m.133522 type:complete len:229 (+) Transcript_42376:196-882(+)